MIRVKVNVGISPGGELVMNEESARQVRREIDAQLAPRVTPAMIAAGVAATHLNLGFPKRFLQSELEGIARRVYAAMRALE